MEEIEALLNEVGSLVVKYEKKALEKGENFNIFRLLNLDSKEVKLHSKLLAELLKPKGSHGLGNTFLKLFIETLVSTKAISNKGLSETNNAVVDIEKPIGAVDTDYNNGGFIDIIIHLSNGNVIVIENKIYAGDQRGQLRRYYNYYKKKGKVPVLVYLTLNGRDPENYSTKNHENPDDEIKVLSLSYKTQIVEWLELCKKSATDHPIVRETIRQYINLINHLNNQTMKNILEEDLTTLILSNPSNISNTERLAEIWNACKLKIVLNLSEDINKIANDLGFEMDLSGSLGYTNTGFEFYKPNWKHSIYFFFESDFGTINVSLDWRDSNDKCQELETKLKNHFENLFYNWKIKNKSSMIWCVEFDQGNGRNWGDFKDRMPLKIRETTEMILTHLNSLESI